MTLIGSGQGASWGRTPEITPQELENTAATQVTRQMMGVVPDTMEIPFTQVGGNVWKYKSDPGRPALPPVDIRRAAKEAPPPANDSWKGILKQLMEQLPPEVKARLQADISKPFEARNPNYAGFENILSFTAKALQWLGKASSPPEADKSMLQRTQENLQLPAKAMKGMLQHTATIFEKGTAFIEMAGPDVQNQDLLVNYLNQGKEVSGELMALLKAIGNPAYESPTQDQLNAMSNKIDLLLAQLNHVPPGKELQILGPAFQAMAAMAQALALSPASPSLFIGLKTALKGIGASQSSLALFDGDLETMLQAIINGLVEPMMPGADKSQKLMMAMLILSGMAGANAFGAILGDYGFGRSPVTNEADQKASKSFNLKVALQLIASSGILDEIFKAISEACGLTGKQMRDMAEPLSTTALLTMTLAATKGPTENVITLLEEIGDHLEGKMEKIETVISNALEESGAGEQIPPEIAAALVQAKTACSNGDYEGFLGACANALELINSSPEEIKEDLDELKEFGVQVMKAASGAVDEDTLTQTGMLTAA